MTKSNICLFAAEEPSCVNWPHSGRMTAESVPPLTLVTSATHAVPVMHIPEIEIIVRAGDGMELLRATLQPGEYVIGRDPECQLHVDADLLSRRHALLTVNYDHVLIEDLGSSNGTSVNGRPVTTAVRLWPNQKIQVGSVSIELRRLKTVSPDVSLAPSAAVRREILPEEFLREKRYEIDGVVAEGGMGAILAAKEATIERTVAMKVMLDASSPDDLVRFVAEAKVTGQLEHPNIVPVHELGVDENDQVFYTMKFVRGITLRKVLESLAEEDEATVQKYPLGALLTIFQKVCDAIAFAHSKGVIHRDLKPENIMLGDYGEVLVMDWGLGKVLGQTGGNASVNDEAARELIRALPAGTATMTGSIMGTPQYMAPEQARGEVETLDARADIYALGAILFHLLALRPSVEGSEVMAIVERVAEGRIEPLDMKAKHPHLPSGRVPASLAAVVHKAMALDPARRYGDVRSLQAEIEAYQNGFATSAEKASTWTQIKLLVKRHKAASIGLAAVLIVGGTLGTKALVEGRRAEREALRANRTLSELKKTAPTLLALAQTESASQRFDVALTKVEAALLLDPTLLPAYWERAWILLGQQRWGEAADAVQLAGERDTSSRDAGTLRQAIEQLAAAPGEAERWSSEAARVIFERLNAEGATGPVFTFASKMKVDTEQRRKLVEDKLRQAWGNDVLVTIVDGFVRVGFGRRPVRSLEPLKGLPIDELMIQNTLIDDLEPLRGMRLIKLSAEKTAIKSVEPLRGMPLQELKVGGTNVRDLTPLAGMPLRTLNLPDGRDLDFSVLRGMPLRIVIFGDNDVSDLSFLAGAPLVRVVLFRHPRLTDVSPLRNASLEFLKLEGTQVRDLSVLRGMPLRTLLLSGGVVSDLQPLSGLPLESLDLVRILPLSDLAPLRGLPIKKLTIVGCQNLLEYTPILDLPQLEELELDRLHEQLLPLRERSHLKHVRAEAFPGDPGAKTLRSAAEFWQAYDAHRK